MDFLYPRLKFISCDSWIIEGKKSHRTSSSSSLSRSIEFGCCWSMEAFFRCLSNYIWFWSKPKKSVNAVSCTGDDGDYPLHYQWNSISPWFGTFFFDPKREKKVSAESRIGQIQCYCIFIQPPPRERANWKSILLKQFFWWLFSPLLVYHECDAYLRQGDRFPPDFFDSSFFSTCKYAIDTGNLEWLLGRVLCVWYRCMIFYSSHWCCRRDRWRYLFWTDRSHSSRRGGELNWTELQSLFKVSLCCSFSAWLMTIPSGVKKKLESYRSKSSFFS